MTARHLIDRIAHADAGHGTGQAARATVLGRHGPAGLGTRAPGQQDGGWGDPIPHGMALRSCLTQARPQQARPQQQPSERLPRLEPGRRRVVVGAEHGQHEQDDLQPTHTPLGLVGVVVRVDALGIAGVGFVGLKAYRAIAAAEYDSVYCSHNLEHYHRHEVPRVLAGFRHVLKAGGVDALRVGPAFAEFARLRAVGAEPVSATDTSTMGWFPSTM